MKNKPFLIIITAALITLFSIISLNINEINIDNNTPIKYVYATNNFYQNLENNAENYDFSYLPYNDKTISVSTAEEFLFTAYAINNAKEITVTNKLLERVNVKASECNIKLLCDVDLRNYVFNGICCGDSSFDNTIFGNGNTLFINIFNKNGDAYLIYESKGASLNNITISGSIKGKRTAVIVNQLKNTPESKIYENTSLFPDNKNNNYDAENNLKNNKNTDLNGKNSRLIYENSIYNSLENSRFFCKNSSCIHNKNIYKNISNYENKNYLLNNNNPYENTFNDNKTVFENVNIHVQLFADEISSGFFINSYDNVEFKSCNFDVRNSQKCNVFAGVAVNSNALDFEKCTLTCFGKADFACGITYSCENLTLNKTHLSTSLSGENAFIFIHNRNFYNNYTSARNYESSPSVTIDDITLYVETDAAYTCGIFYAHTAVIKNCSFTKNPLDFCLIENSIYAEISASGFLFEIDGNKSTSETSNNKNSETDGSKNNTENFYDNGLENSENNLPNLNDENSNALLTGNTIEAKFIDVSLDVIIKNSKNSDNANSTLNDASRRNYGKNVSRENILDNDKKSSVNIFNKISDKLNITRCNITVFTDTTVNIFSGKANCVEILNVSCMVVSLCESKSDLPTVSSTVSVNSLVVKNSKFNFYGKADVFALSQNAICAEVNNCTISVESNAGLSNNVNFPQNVFCIGTTKTAIFNGCEFSAKDFSGNSALVGEVTGDGQIFSDNVTENAVKTIKKRFTNITNYHNIFSCNKSSDENSGSLSVNGCEIFLESSLCDANAAGTVLHSENSLVSVKDSTVNLYLSVRKAGGILCTAENSTIEIISTQIIGKINGAFSGGIIAELNQSTLTTEKCVLAVTFSSDNAISYLSGLAVGKADKSSCITISSTAFLSPDKNRLPVVGMAFSQQWQDDFTEGNYFGAETDFSQPFYYNGREIILSVQSQYDFEITDGSGNYTAVINAGDYLIDFFNQGAKIFTLRFSVMKSNISQALGNVHKETVYTGNAVDLQGLFADIADQLTFVKIFRNEKPVSDITDVGSYTVYVAAQNKNEVIRFVSEVKILQADLPLFFEPYFDFTQGIKHYDGKPFELNAISDTVGIDFRIEYRGTDLNGNQYKSEVAPVAAGKYDALLYVIVSENYKFSGQREYLVERREIEILPFELTVSVENGVFDYGEEIKPVIVAEGFIDGDGLIDLIGYHTIAFKFQGETPLMPGEHIVRVYGEALSDKYVIAYVDAVITVNKISRNAPSYSDVSVEVVGNNVRILTTQSGMEFSLDGQSFFRIKEFTGLEAGLHTLTVRYYETEASFASDSITIEFEVADDNFFLVLIIIITAIIVSFIVVVLVVSRKKFLNRTQNSVK